MRTISPLAFVLLAVGCTDAQSREFDARNAPADQPEIVGEGFVSTLEAEEIKLAVSPDGRQQVWGAVGKAARGKLDIWERHRQGDGTWSQPRPLGINGPGEDFDPAFSPDGTRLYFHSDRPGGYGRTDIYYAERRGEFGFAEPRNLGPRVNSEDAEWAPWALADGRILFASDGWGGQCRHDIFLVDPEGDAPPTNLGPAINGELSEFDPTVSPDGQTIVFSRGLYGPQGEDFSVWRSDKREGEWQRARPVALGCGTYTIGLAFLPDGSFTFSSRCPDPEAVRMQILRISRSGLDSAA